MSDACTIYSPVVDFTIVDVLNSTLGSQRLDIRGDRNNWETIIAGGGDVTLTLNSLVRVTPGDRFSKLILSTLNFFRRAKDTAGETKEESLNRVLATNWLIGVVAEPNFSAAHNHYETIFAVAKQLDGMVFNGREMLDSDGTIILTG